MPFSAESIGRKRYRMNRTLRFCALTLFMVWLISVLFSVIEELTYGADNWSDAILDTVRMSPFLVGAAVLAVGQRPLTAWLVPRPKGGCPLCGYGAGAPPPAGRCPECGARLAGEPAATPPA